MSIALLLAIVAPAQEPAPAAPSFRLDEVGLAGRSDPAAGSWIVHRTLPDGSFAEVTALDSGATIIAMVRAGASLPPDRVANLSPAAAAALRLSETPLVPVRVRPVTPSPQDRHVLQGGGAVTRLDAPLALLVALRRKLPALRPTPEMTVHSVAPPRVAKPFRPVSPPAPTRPPASGKYMVQIAALSDPNRAAALAKSVGGVVRGAGPLYRVQAGPFATRVAADTARADLARRGFGDARIIAQD